MVCMRLFHHDVLLETTKLKQQKERRRASSQFSDEAWEISFFLPCSCVHLQNNNK